MKLPPNVENRPENSRKNGYRNKNQSPFSINLSAVFSDGTSGVACVSNPAWPKGTMSSILPHGEVAVILCFVLLSGGFRKYSGSQTYVFEAGFYLREGILQRSGTVFS